MVRVHLRPQIKPLDDIEGFLDSLRFDTGVSWINWGLVLVLLIENYKKMVLVQYPIK
jgi:hypothetical protein